MSSTNAPSKELRDKLQREQVAGHAAVRKIVAESRHPNSEQIARDFDKRAWEIETGVAEARSTWEALSAPQRRVLEAMGEGRALCRAHWSETNYNVTGEFWTHVYSICRLPTVKNLVRRELIASDNPSDPMKRLTITDRGRFVLKHGRPK